MDILTEFYNYLITKRQVKPITAYRHRNTLRLILKNCAAFTEKKVTAYITTLRTEGKRASYLNSIVNTVRVYTQFLKDTSRQCDKTLRYYQFFKDEEIIKSVFSDEEIEAFLELPPPEIHRNGRSWPNNPTLYNRWTVFYSICAYTGMRTGEVAGITTDDIDWGRNCFILNQTKTGMPRLVPIPTNIHVLLKDYLSQLKDSILFPGANNVDWHYNFHTRLKRLGICRPHLTPYSFRHSLITRLLEEDVNIFKVQKIVGHRQLNTTAAYTHLTTKDIQEAILKHPLIKKQSDPKLILQSIKEAIEAYRLKTNDRFDYYLEETNDGLRFEIKLKSNKP
jgi:integrase